MRSYVHPDNSHLVYTDWREPDNRVEGFLRWLQWRMRYCDLDHYGPNNAYRDFYGMTNEQAHWFSVIFGMTYQSEMAWVIFSCFPDFAEIDLNELDAWNRHNMPRMKYAKDTKYNKGHIVKQVESIMTATESYGYSISKYVESHLTDDANQNFDTLYDSIINDFHKYGRMTTWLTLQTLYETAGVNCYPNTLLAHDKSSWSVRFGLYYLYDLEHKIDKDNPGKLTDSDIQWILNIEKTLYAQCERRIDKSDVSMFSYYLLESQLCQYKKLMLGGDYAGHSSCDHISRASYLDDLWPEVDFSPFFNNVMNTLYHPLVRGKSENKVLRHLTAKTGQMINMHDEFLDMPDMYKELGINPSMVTNDPGDLKLLNSRIDEYIESERGLLGYMK